MTNAQAAALTRIARLCARRGDYTALRAYVDGLLVAPDVRGSGWDAPLKGADGTRSWPGPVRPVAQKAGFHVFGWRLW